MTWNSCASCKKDRNEDDLVWVNIEGKADMKGRPYCVECAPQEDDEDLCEICGVSPKRYPESKWCEECRDDFKESDNA